MYQLFTFDKCSLYETLMLGETRGRVYENSLYFLCDFPVNIKLFQSKKFIFKKSKRVQIPSGIIEALNQHQQQPTFRFLVT